MLQRIEIKDRDGWPLERRPVRLQAVELSQRLGPGRRDPFGLTAVVMGLDTARHVFGRNPRSAQADDESSSNGCSR
jgi:hypothetical protein